MRMFRRRTVFVVAGALSLLLGVLLFAGCDDKLANEYKESLQESRTATAKAPQQPAAPPAASSGQQATPVAIQGQSASFTLGTDLQHGQLAFVGIGGAIDKIGNPAIEVAVGAKVEVTLVNGDGVEHDISFPDFNATSQRITVRGSQTKTSFTANKEGSFTYFCTVPGHRAAGMEGKLIVGKGGQQPQVQAVSIVRDPAEVPPPIGRRGPVTHRVTLEAVEVTGQLADGTSYYYFTFGGKVPGPMYRVRTGDTMQFTLKNNSADKFVHSIDLHAVTGPGGGATLTQVPPGGEKTFTFKALNPGLYVYHCATPSVAHHITSGMYGLILVEPENGLPPVDREFYVMQGEIYTQKAFGEKGPQEFSVQKMLAEQAEYLVLNGAVGSLTAEKPLRARVGETVRIYFGVGGPNYTSSFHVIGEIFDRVYMEGAMSPPATDVQTTLVPAGGAAIVEFKLDVPGRYILVDHSLSRLERGLAGFILVEGPENPSVFKEGNAPN